MALFKQDAHLQSILSLLLAKTRWLPDFACVSPADVWPYNNLSLLTAPIAGLRLQYCMGAIDRVAAALPLPPSLRALHLQDALLGAVWDEPWLAASSLTELSLASSRLAAIPPGLAAAAALQLLNRDGNPALMLPAVGCPADPQRPLAQLALLSVRERATDDAWSSAECHWLMGLAHA